MTLAIDQMTVVIPAFNEALKIRDVLVELQARMPGLRILVVDDGSTDETAAIAAESGVDVLSHPANRGYGAALKTGFRHSSTPYLAMYDADGQHRPEDLIHLLKSADNCDMVVGARTRNCGGSHLRRPGKWILGRLANILVGRRIPDLNSGLRVMRRDVVIRYLHLLPDGFSASTTSTICILRRGYSVKFVPIETRTRVGHSTVRQARDGLGTISLMIRLTVLFNPHRVFLPPAFFLIAGGLAYGLSTAFFIGRGFPTLGVLAVITGLITGMFGLLADQISNLRLELFEKETG